MKNLPPELLGKIAQNYELGSAFSFETMGTPTQSRGQSTLLNLSLVSKAWYSEAQRSLWSEAFVFVPSGENNIPTASRWLKSLEIMLQRGHSRYLKRLGIRLDRSSWGVPEKNAFRQSILSTTSTILDNVPHLETLLVSSDSIQLSPDLDLAGLCFSNRHFPALRMMDLLVYAGWERNHPLQVYPFLLRHPHISVLRMHVLDGTLLGTKRVPEALPHLKRFVGGMEEAKLLSCQGTLQSLELFVDLSNSGSSQQRFLKVVKSLDGPFPAVKDVYFRRIRLPILNLEVVAQLDRCFPNLEHLEGLVMNTSFIDEIRTCPTLCKGLLPKLKQLTLFWNDLVSDRSDHQPMEEAMRLLPLSFPELRVCSQGMGIQERGFLKRTLSCEYGKDGKVVNWEGPENPDST
ncbi:hypothetical protein SISSUDRAFT_1131426 [Sistotremastrum suecicum HHB10207 ss-3]|uniref:Uncharacterized protein n=1 Tax=Sistotremastrum suecicum HHB10207 ss-3 TaxID=1314776 RepID=A0A166A6A0_9AGAM|nr:hypothetical protein SISSUDRAFT_1131426 [Sistotremastrum suecicum HHB10207 ss-3]